MKAVLISIRPKWCEKIISGEKTIEVRKTRPKMYRPFKCYIYCTKDKHLAFMQNASGTNLIACMNAETAIPVGGFLGNGKVIGEFLCDEIININGAERIPSDAARPTCLEPAELHQYLGAATGFGWHISNLKIYDTPRELDAFRLCTVSITGPAAMVVCRFDARRRAGAMWRETRELQYFVQGQSRRS